MMKNEGIDPNTWMLPETAASFEVCNWRFGHLVHHPAYAFLGHPNGRVNLKDLSPEYAGKLVDAGFPYLRRKQIQPEQPVSNDDTTDTATKGRKAGKK